MLPKAPIHRLRMPPSSGFDLAADDHAIDEEAGQIRGFSVMELGEIHADGLHAEADAETLQAVASLANAAVEATKVADRRLRGLKMRLGHPQMSADAITKTMAAARDFRVAPGGRVRADLQFLEAANVEDKRHLISLARDRPDFLATSLVVSGNTEKRLNEDGSSMKDDEGKDLLPFFRPSFVHGIDFVDKGAATRGGLFSGTTALLSAEAAEQLGKVSKLKDFAQRVRRFLGLIDLEHPGMGDKLREAIALAPPGETMVEEPKDSAPEPEFDNARALRHLEASGYDVAKLRAVPTDLLGQPKATPEEQPAASTDSPAKIATPDAAPGPPDAGGAELRQEMAEMKVAFAEMKEQNQAAQAEVVAAKLGAFRNRLDALHHVDQALREGAAKAVGDFLELGEAEAAEKLVAGYELMPNVGEMAQLNTQISVTYEDGKARMLDISPYARLAEGEDGPRAVLVGDREEMAEAAAISEIEDPVQRRMARVEAFKARAGKEAS